MVAQMGGRGGSGYWGDEMTTSGADNEAGNPFLWPITFTIALTRRNAGRTFTFPIPLFSFWKVYNALNTTKSNRWSDLITIIELAGSMAGKLHREKYPDPDQALTEIWTKLALDLSEKSLLETLEDPPEEEPVIGFTYRLLRARMLTRAQAAGFASALLRKKVEEVSPDAWRVKVDRWAERNKQPPVGIRKRQKKK